MTRTQAKRQLSAVLEEMVHAKAIINTSPTVNAMRRSVDARIEEIEREQRRRGFLPKQCRG